MTTFNPHNFRWFIRKRPPSGGLFLVNDASIDMYKSLVFFVPTKIVINDIGALIF